MSDPHKDVDDSSPIFSSVGWLRVNESSILSMGTETGISIFDEMIVPSMN